MLTVLMAAFIIVTLVLLRQQADALDHSKGMGKAEGWAQKPACVLDSKDINQIIESVHTIRDELDRFKNNFPPDPAEFALVYMLMVTRMEYLIATYGEKLTMHEFMHMFMDVNVQRALAYFESTHSAVLQEAFTEFHKIFVLLERTRENSACPVCDPMYIRQNMRRVDNEFSMFFASLFTHDIFKHLPEASKKRLMGLEIDMLSATELVDTAIDNRDIDPHGHLDVDAITNAMTRLKSGYIKVKFDTELLKIFTPLSLEGINAFIHMKDMMIKDLKKCIVTPVFYGEDNYVSRGVVLTEGLFTAKELADAYGLPKLGSFRVPPTYSVILNMSDGDIVTYNADISHIDDNKSSAILSVTVLPKKKYNVIPPRNQTTTLLPAMPT